MGNTTDFSYRKWVISFGKIGKERVLRRQHGKKERKVVKGCTSRPGGSAQLASGHKDGEQ